MADEKSKPERPAPIWLMQLAGLAAVVYFVYLESSGGNVPVFAWGIVGALVIPPDLYSAWIGSKFGGGQ